VALSRLSDGAALATERLGRKEPSNLDPSTAVAVLLRGGGRSIASAACHWDHAGPRLPRQGGDIAQCAEAVAGDLRRRALSAAMFR